MSWTRAGRSTRPRSCSATRRCPPRRFTRILTQRGCGPRSTRSPALASWPESPGERRGRRERRAGHRGGAGGCGPGAGAGSRCRCCGAAGGEAGSPAGPRVPGGGRLGSGDMAAGPGNRAPADPVGRQPPAAGGRSRPEGSAPARARAWEAALLADPGLDGTRWDERAEPVPVTGQVNLRGLAPLAVVEMLYGVQQRVRAGCTSYCRTLRVLARELRQAQAPSLADLPAQEEKGRQALLSSLAMHAARAFADPRSEIGKDRWDLTVLGHHGWLAFTGISQEWLRESVKAWAAHDLPRRRGKQAGARLHEIVGAMIRLS